MSIKEELGNARDQFKLLSLYQRFEHIVITILTALIAIIVVVAVWNLTLKIVFGLILPGNLDPSDYATFQGVFGTIFTVIIALEFKKSILVMAPFSATVPSDDRRRQRWLAEDHVGRLFCHHNRRRVGITGGNERHDGCVDDT